MIEGDNIIDIKDILLDIIEIEGGYVDHPNDKGGPTKYGITLKILESYRGTKVTIEDVKSLSKEEAYRIFRERYYLKPNIIYTPSLIQPIMVDMAINHGPQRAIRVLQRILNELGYGELLVDGLLGGKTSEASRRASNNLEEFFVNILVKNRKLLYYAIAVNDPSQMIFIKGWLGRADIFTLRRKDGSRMVNETILH